MKYKKILALILILLSVFLIYKFNYKKEYTYLAIGDGLSLGENPYGLVEYGYADYLAIYLKEEQKLKNFSKDFSKSKYYIEELLNDLKHNKFIRDGYNIKRELREANLVTLNIGFDDLYDYVYSMKSESGDLNGGVDSIVNKYQDLLIELKRYTKGRIILVGYYHLPYDNSQNLNEVIKMFNKRIIDISDKEGVEYIDISTIFNDYMLYLPNPNVFYPNTKGYHMIYQQIIRNINF